VNAFYIRYRFAFPNGQEHVFSLELSGATAELTTPAPANPPAWTALDYHQCKNCPLSTAEVTHCPSAVHLAGVLDCFTNVVSYDDVTVTVETEARAVTAQTSAQQGLASLIGLIMASSGCPRTAVFRPMARFHLPFSSEAETTLRSAAMYLLAQHFIACEGGVPDAKLAALERVYSGIHEVNRGIARRLRAAARQDAIVNAVVLLDVNTTLVPTAIQELLNEMKPAFQALLDAVRSTETARVEK
jgi:hypothetical protein